MNDRLYRNMMFISHDLFYIQQKYANKWNVVFNIFLLFFFSYSFEDMAPKQQL